MPIEVYGPQKVLSKDKMKEHEHIEYDIIRHVHLNRGGRHIGAIVKVNCAYPYLAYLSWRRCRKEGVDRGHFFRIFRGYGLDKCMWKDLIIKPEYYDIRKVIIEYTKVDGKKVFYISNKEDWFDAANASYTKEVGEDENKRCVQKTLL